MDNLEEKLRNSRRKERPDLKPPVGGWEAVQASLAATAAATAAGTTAAAANAAAAGKTGAVVTGAAVAGKASLMAVIIKAVIGVTVLGGVAAGGWLVMAESDTTDAASDPVGISATTPTGTASGETVSASGMPVTELSPAEIVETGAAQTALPANEKAASGTGKISGATNDPLPENNRKIKGWSSGNGNSGSAQNANRTAVGTTASANAGSSSSAENDTPLNDTDGSPAGITPPVPPVTPALPGSSPARPEDSRNPVAPPVPAADTSAARLPAYAGNTESAAGSGEQRVEIVQGKTATPGLDRNDVPVELSTGPTILLTEPITELAFEYSRTPLALETEVIVPESTINGGKNRGWAAWQVHGGVATSFSNNHYSFGDPNIYEEALPGGTVSSQVTLASGEVVLLDVRGAEFNRSGNFDSQLYRLGVTRQLKWGGALRATLGHYRGEYTDGLSAGQLSPDQFVFNSLEKTRATFLDIELQYTFLRRHRFRPYVGLGTVLLMNYKDIYQNQFVSGSGETGIRDDYSSSSPFSTSIDPTITAGFQYQVTAKWSVGAQVWGNTGFNVLVEAPFGIEARYILD